MSALGVADVDFSKHMCGLFVLRRRLVVTGLAVLFCLTAYASPPRNPLFTHLTTEDGLSNGWVRAIYQDTSGFLWIATANGLNRYDGYTFRIYRHVPADSESLAHNSVHSIYEDSSHRLWIGTEGGLSRYEHTQDSFSNFPLRSAGGPRPVSNNVQAITQDRDGLLWMSTVDGLSCFDPVAEVFSHFDYQRPETHEAASFALFGSLVIDDAGSIWVGTLAYGLARFDPETKSFSPVNLSNLLPGRLQHTMIMALALAPPNQLWVGLRGGGLCLLDISHTKPKVVRHWLHDSDDPASLSTDMVMSLLLDSSNNLWIGTENGGLDVLAPDTTMIQHNRYRSGNPASLNNDSIYSLFEDAAGNLWAGTFAGGVNTYFRKRQAVQHYNAIGDGLSYNVVTSFQPDENGNLWIGTDGGGLNYFDRQRDEFRSYSRRNSNLNRDAVLSLASDAQGRLWIGMWDGGISRFDPDTQRFEPFTSAQGLAGDNVLDILVDKNGHLWIACFFAGLVHFDPATGRNRLLGESDVGIDTTSVRTLIPLSDSRIMIGTSIGFSVFSLEDGSFAAFTHEPGDPTSLSNNIVLSGYDAGEFLWVGTADGLGKLDLKNGVFRNFFESDGLPNSTINSIVEASDGHLWLSTDRGIARFDPTAEVIKTYGVGDGLQGNQFYPDSYGRTSDGELLFGGTNGFNIIRPELFQTNEQQPHVVITGFEIFNQPVPINEDSPLSAPISLTDVLSLSYRDSVFSFEFAALDFTAPEYNQYAYRMVGFDEDFVYCGSRRTATYTNLAPGKYVFRVIASNNDGIWNEQGASVEIRISPPFWRTWWFRTVSLLAIIAAALAAHRYRLHAVKRRNRELEEFVRERTAALKTANKELEAFAYSVSHDLRAPLRSITGFITALEQDSAAQLDQTAKDYIARVLGASARMSELIDALLGLSRIMRVEVHQKHTDLSAIAQSIAEELVREHPDRAIEFVVPSGISTKCDPALARVLLENLLGNSFKFTASAHQARIEFGAEMAGLTQTFYVRDNGAGFDMEYADRLFRPFQRLHSEKEFKGTGIGLATCRRIVDRHQGKIWATSAPDEGSTFFFTLKESVQTPEISRRRRRSGTSGASD